MTHKKIAELAGVAPSTVSKALSGSKEISREVSEKIVKIAEEGGYFSEKKNRKKEYARSFRPNIAVLCPEILGDYYSVLATDFAREIEKLGGSTAIYITGFDEGKDMDLISSFERQGIIDGVISLMNKNYGQNLSLPVVYTEEIGIDIQQDAVYCTMNAAMSAAVSYLVKLGHTKIGFIGETHTEKKWLGYVKAMEAHGLTPEKAHCYIIPERFEKIGYAAAEQILRKRERPTAFVTAYDAIALSVMYALENSGVHVPRDVSLIGVNDTPVAAYAAKPLTSVRIFNDEKCPLVVKFLYERILEHYDGPPRRIQIQPQLVVRQTATAPWR